MFKNLSSYRSAKSPSGKLTFARTGLSKNTPMAVAVTKQTPTQQQENLQKVESFYNGYTSTQFSQGVNFANSSMTNQNFLRMLDGFVNIDDPATLRRKYKDMYYFDNICGTAVDLRSELPFSDYSLVGISDPNVLSIYEDAMEELRVLQFLRRLLADYYVIGAAIYSLIWDDDRKIFFSPRPLNVDNCQFIQTPLLNDEPFINYNPDDYLKPFLAAKEKSDPRILEYLKKRPGLSKLFLNTTGAQGKLELPPETTLYLERTNLSTPPSPQGSYDSGCLSYYSRALKFYEYEKRIYRGTLDLAEKRLKSILHIMVGSDTVIPDQLWLGEVADAFKTANLDPTDAVIATNALIQTNEVRQPTDFWRYDESYDFLTRAKLSALGLNEDFMSGSQNYNTADNAMTVFLEQLKADRSHVTDYVFYKKIFPFIAKENGFIAKDDIDSIKDKLDDQEEASNRIHSQDIKLNPFNQEKDYQKKIRYQIPRIHWHKSLKPKGDKDYMDNLQALKDQGIPIGWSMQLVAAGVNIDDLLSSLEEDNYLKDKLKPYMQDQEGEGSSEDEGGDFGTEESIFRDPSNILQPLGLNVRAKIGDLNNEQVQSAFKPYKIDKAGKRIAMSKREEQMYRENLNKHISQTLAEKQARDIVEENEKYNSTK